MANTVPRTAQEYEAEIARLRDELKAMEDIATSWCDARNELWWLAGDAMALLREIIERPRHFDLGTFWVKMYQGDFDRIDALLEKGPSVR